MHIPKKILNITDKKSNHLYFPPISEVGVDLESLERSLETFYFKEALRLVKG